MATPSGRKKGDAPSRATAKKLTYTVTVWDNRSTPRFSLPIEYPNPEEWRNISYDYRSMVYSLFDAIRFSRRFYFIKPLTITAQLLTNLFVLHQKLPIVTVDYWERSHIAGSVRFFNAHIDKMEPFTRTGWHVEDDNPSGMYYHVGIKAEDADKPQGSEWREYERSLMRWWPK